MQKTPSKLEILMNWQCNQRCIFCSVGHKLVDDGGIRTWSEIKKDLELAKKRDASIVSFSGGEPTIRKDLVKGIKLAHSLGFETIEIQTNGCMLKYKEYFEELIDAGVNRVLVSIHAPNAELEDFLTQTRGSFDAKVQGLRYLEEYNIEKRTNTVINRYNYRLLPEMAKFLLGFKKNTKNNHLNFVIPDGFAKQNFRELVPKMSEAKPFIEKACSILVEGGAAPFLHNLYPCIISGYSQVIAELSTTDTLLIGPDFKIDLQENRHKYRVKGPQCKNCKYDNICVGPFKEYIKIMGFDEFKPVKGEKIKPGEFRLQG